MEKNQTSKPAFNPEIFNMAIKGKKCFHKKKNHKNPLGKGFLGWYSQKNFVAHNQYQT